MQEPVDIAITHYENGYSCAQAVLAAFASRYGLTHDAVHGLAAPFGAGMSRRQTTCGAVTCALMVLGLHYWDRHTDPRENKEKIYQISQVVHAGVQSPQRHHPVPGEAAEHRYQRPASLGAGTPDAPVRIAVPELRACEIELLEHWVETASCQQLRHLP